MSKSLLIIHTPNYCGECACHVFGHEGYRYCCLSGHRLDDKDYCIERLVNCPLKPMPEKLDVNEIEKSFLQDKVSIIKLYEANGYNDCINEILGEEK